MSVASEIEKIASDLSNAYEAIENLNGTIPEHKNTDNLAAAISSIPVTIIPDPVINGGGEDDIDDYIYTSPASNFDISGGASLIKSLPTLNMANRTSIENLFAGCDNLTTLPSLTNITNITNATYLASSCNSLVNVPYYYLPNCRDFTGAFTESLLLSNQSIQNIMQMLINCDNYNYEVTEKILEDVIPADICYKAEDMANYQDFLSAGWLLNRDNGVSDGGENEGGEIVDNNESNDGEE